MPRVLVAGPASWNLVARLARLPPPSPGTVFAQRWHEVLGGTSAGKALNLRRLGVDVTLVTLVGDDATGERITGELRAAGVEVVARRSANGSERHVNLVDAAGHRVSVYLTLPEPGPGDAPAVDPWPGLAGADAVVVDLAGHSRPLLAAARAAGRPVWCDLHDDDGTDAFRAPFRDGADVVLASADRLPDPEAYLRERVAAGARLAVCTLGADGALALERGGPLLRVPAEPVADVVDTEGAGDAFCAGLLAGELRGLDLPARLALAASAAAACVRSPRLAGDLPPAAPPG